MVPLPHAGACQATGVVDESSNLASQSMIWEAFKMYDAPAVPFTKLIVL